MAWNGCWWGSSTNAAMTERVTLHLRDMAAAHRVRQALEVMEVDVAPPSDRGTPASSPGVRCGPLSSSSTASDSVLGVIVTPPACPARHPGARRRRAAAEREGGRPADVRLSPANLAAGEARTVLPLRSAEVHSRASLCAVLARCRATT